jgi:hypothetical protein
VEIGKGREVVERNRVIERVIEIVIEKGEEKRRER